MVAGHAQGPGGHGINELLSLTCPRELGMPFSTKSESEIRTLLKKLSLPMKHS